MSCLEACICWYCSKVAAKSMWRGLQPLLFLLRLAAWQPGLQHLRYLPLMPPAVAAGIVPYRAVTAPMMLPHTIIATSCNSCSLTLETAGKLADAMISRFGFHVCARRCLGIWCDFRG